MPWGTEPASHNKRRPRVVVVGGSGFVGSSTVEQLRLRGADVIVQSAPRVKASAASPIDVVQTALASRIVDDLSIMFAGAQVIINAAGVADAASSSEAALIGANAVLPRILREAATKAGASRFVHVSSAGVQGRLQPLDESREVAPFSPYTRSKALGEQGLEDCPETTIFRPTSVHGPGRRTSQSLVRLARSSVASVAGDGSLPTPQVMVQNVASAIAFSALHEGDVPAVVIQPWEGLTTSGLIRLLGNREPRHIPHHAARATISVLGSLGKRSGKVTANVRRMEMLWFGQAQVDGWLSTTEWKPRLGKDAWSELRGAICRQISAHQINGE